MADLKKYNATIKKINKQWNRTSWQGGDAYTNAMGCKLWLDKPGQADDKPSELKLPELPHNSEFNTFVDPDVILAALRFRSVEPGRYALNTAYFEKGRLHLRMTVTDGRRLVSQVVGTETSKETKALHVDGDSLEHLVRIMASAVTKKGTLSFAVIDQESPFKDGTNLALVIKGTPSTYSGGVAGIAVLSCAEGQYPDYRSVIPVLKHSVKLNGLFFDAMDVVGRVSSVESQAVRIEIGTMLDKGKDVGSIVGLRAQHKGIGKSTIDAHWAGEAPEAKVDDFAECCFGIDPHYVADVSKVIQARNYKMPEVTLRFTDKDTGVLFTTNGADSQSTYLVIPIDI